MSARHSSSYWLIAAACAVGACTGSIGERGSTEGSPSGAGGGQSNSPGYGNPVDPSSGDPGTLGPGISGSGGGSSGPGGVPIGAPGAVPPGDPGRVTLHRLNRAEYNNTVRDLFGTALQPADDFPTDDHGYNFDNIADVLSVPPSLVELYERAAENLVNEALPTTDDPSSTRIMVCDPSAGGDACVRQIIETFAKHAWRRPPTTAEVDRLVTFVDLAEEQGENIDAGIRLAVQATLLSPHFIYRVELDTNPTSEEAHPLGDYELASRLSYFLWSSMPDDTLFGLADAGRLADPAAIEAQARRMLGEAKASAVVDNFAGQWLFTRALDQHEPDYNYFPDYDDGLRDALKEETRLFFEEFVNARLPIEDLLRARFTFVNDRLARHYGLPVPSGSGFHRVDLSTDQRGGLLRQAGILTVTSYPVRTSPVKRGKWVLGQLLCSEPPPPPDNVDADLSKEEIAASTLREVLAQHRAKEECAVCHNQMDPVGLALENFDGIGRWREADNGAPIDATGVLPDGTPLDGPASLVEAVANDPRFGACIARQLYTYALGRGPTPRDAPYLDAILNDLGLRGFSFEDLVVAIVKSEPFRMRRGEVQ